MKATRGRGRGRGRGASAAAAAAAAMKAAASYVPEQQQQQQQRTDSSDPTTGAGGGGGYTETDLRAAMNAHGAGLLGALGQQMNAHLTSLTMFESATTSLRGQCQNMVVEIGKLLEAIELYQNTHAQVMIHAALLRQIVAEFAQHIHNSQVFGA